MTDLKAAVERARDDIAAGYLCAVVYTADLRLLLAALEAGQWRPIAEAKRETDKEVIGWVPGDEDHPMGWQFIVSFETWDEDHPGQWTDSHGDTVSGITHFRPLPLPPASEG
jgi:hypothetical protein